MQLSSDNKYIQLANAMRNERNGCSWGYPKVVKALKDFKSKAQYYIDEDIISSLETLIFCNVRDKICDGRVFRSGEYSYEKLELIALAMESSTSHLVHQYTNTFLTPSKPDKDMTMLDIVEQSKTLIGLDYVDKKNGYSDLLIKLTKGKPLNIKVGFDPTSADIHLGHTVLLNVAKKFQDLGHNVIILIGSFTASVGDPTGRNKLRPMMRSKQIAENAATYLEQVFKILNRDKTTVVDNNDWLGSMTAREMIDLMAMSTVSQMLNRRDFKDRFEQQVPISLHEFSYPLLQGYDSYHLKADVELGGEDQLFNLNMGRSIQKDYEVEEQICITVPLLIGTDGTIKMSKSVGNCIGVTDSPGVMFNKLMNIPDALYPHYAKLLSENHSGLTKPVNVYQYKQFLAKEIVERFHGKDAAETAHLSSGNVLPDGFIPDDIKTHTIEAGFTTDIYISAALKIIGFAKNHAQAKDYLINSAVKVDDEVVGISFKFDKGEYLVKVGKTKICKLSIK